MNAKALKQSPSEKVIALQEAPKKMVVVFKVEMLSPHYLQPYRDEDRIVSCTVPAWLLDPTVTETRENRTFVVSLNDKESLLKAIGSILAKI